MNLSWFRDWFRLLRKEAKDWQLARSHRRRLAQVCVSDLPRSGNRTQPRPPSQTTARPTGFCGGYTRIVWPRRRPGGVGVEALRNPGYPILNVDRPEGAEGKTRLRWLL
jgi:hypothetical protein